MSLFAASQIGGRASLRRRTRELLLLELEAVALRGHDLAFEQPPHDVELLLEDAQPPGRQPEGIVLLLPVAETEAEHEAAVGDGVEGGRVLRHLDRVEQRQQEDAGADAHLPRVGRDAREQRYGLQHLVRLREEVLAGGHVVESRGRAPAAPARSSRARSGSPGSRAGAVLTGRGRTAGPCKRSR